MINEEYGLFHSFLRHLATLCTLQANLTHLFNWNVKQLFLYLTAEYETADNKLNQVVLWDKIIQRGENAVLDYKGRFLSRATLAGGSFERSV